MSGQVKDRVEQAAAGKLESITRPLLLFPEVSILVASCARQSKHLLQHLMSTLKYGAGLQHS